LDYRPATLGLHLFNIVFACVALGVSFNAGLACYWRGIVLATCCAIIGGTTAISLIRHEDVPLFITALLFSTGTGCLIPWNERWQAALNIFALAAFAIDEALIPTHDPYLYYRWLGMLNGITIAQLSAYLAGVYRRGLAVRYRALAQSERRTADGEAKLRKIFESTSDAITIFSLVDGRVIEVNQRVHTHHRLHARRSAGRSARRAARMGRWAAPPLFARAESQRRTTQHGRPDPQS
jgi:hypothetical protein